MVKLTCPRSTSRAHGTLWELNSSRRICISHRIALEHGSIIFFQDHVDCPFVSYIVSAERDLITEESYKKQSYKK